MGEIKRTRYDCDSGVALLVKPLSPFIFQQLRDLSLKKFPDPNKEDYELPYPEGIEPAIPGSKIPAEDNEDYRNLVEKIANQRAQFVSRQVILLACEPADDVEKVDISDRFADDILALSKTLELPSSVWEATLLYCVITSQKEQAELTMIAESRLPLTPGEVVNGVKLFRLAVPGQGVNGMVRPASGVQGKERSKE